MPWPNSSLFELCSLRVMLSAITEVSRASMLPRTASTAASITISCHCDAVNTGICSAGRPVGISPICRMSMLANRKTETSVPATSAISCGGSSLIRRLGNSAIRPKVNTSAFRRAGCQ